jgi:uncharacterized protein (DUF2249 family)
MRALRQIGEGGDTDAACRLAAQGWSALRHDWPREAQRLNALMHALTGPKAVKEKEKPMTDNENLDVRSLIPAERHRTIFESWHGLKPGTGFVLINDHDPKPLYYQFDAEHTGEFTWDYLESGPAVWRVRIGKTAAA